MKIAASIIALAGTASAFTSPAAKHSVTSLRMSAEPVVEEEITPVVAAVAEEPVVAALPEKSMAMPFMDRPMFLDGSMAGDVGFDPIGFAKSSDDLMNFREAEVKHARLAMLAAAGWPLSELFDKKIATAIGMAPLVDANDRAPSVLNGGLGKVSPAYWAAVIVLAGAVDLYGQSKKSQPDYFPGNLGFDPLGVYPKDVKGQEWFQTAEIKNGRLAMIAITAFAVQEFVSKLGVIDETPLFFKPIGIVLKEYANSGYIQ